MSDIQTVLAVQSKLLAAKPKLTALKQSCDGLESTFLKTIVSQMRKSAGDVHFGKEFGGDMYRDMYDGAISDMLAAKGTLGVAKTMFSSIAPRVMNEAVKNGKSKDGM